MISRRFIKRNPDKGYFGRQLWLPKKHINTRSVKSGLEFPVADDQGMSYIQLWYEDGDHIIVPREFIARRHYENLPFPVVSVLPSHFPRVDFRSNITLDYKEPEKTTQRAAFASMEAAHCGILNLSCIAGDTKINFNRGGKGFSMPIEKAHRHFHGIVKRYKWDQNIPTDVRSNKGGHIGLHEIENIIYKGKRLTTKITLEDGKSVRLTGDHEVQTTHGWVQAQHLKIDDKVITDGERVESKKKKKRAYKRVAIGEAHPFSRPQTNSNGSTTYLIEEHRIVVEAGTNLLSLEEFISRCKNGDIHGLNFIDPSEYHVHHTDEDIYNNSLSNLEVLPSADHLAKHRPGSAAFGYGIPTPVSVKKIERGRFEDVYDIMCTGPHHNFVANGVILHNCGKGKTVLALNYVAKKRVPTLVVVNNTTLINQWQDRIRDFLEVPGGVGVIQGPPNTWDWEGRGICVAMIHSLALRRAELPQGMDRYFGLVIYDEVHHLSAPLFSQTAPLFFGERHGLTATNNREDGLEVIYQYHVGDAYHKDLMQDMKPRIYFQQCPVSINTRDPAVSREVHDKAGRLNIPKLRNYLGNLPEVNDFIAEKLQAPIAAGRKVLVLSHSVGQLRLLNAMFEDSGLCTGREKPEKRLETLRTKQLSFGTLQLVREALDEDTLDTLYFITPFGSQEIEDGGLNTLQQGMGRIQRFREGKKTPVVIILDHVYIQKMHRMCGKLKRVLSAWPDEQGGALEYTTLRPYSEEAIND